MLLTNVLIVTDIFRRWWHRGRLGQLLTEKMMNSYPCHVQWTANDIWILKQRSGHLSWVLNTPVCYWVNKPSSTTPVTWYVVGGTIEALRNVSYQNLGETCCYYQPVSILSRRLEWTVCKQQVCKFCPSFGPARLISFQIHGVWGLWVLC